MFAIKSAKKKKQEEEKHLIRMTGIKINGNPVLEENNKIFFLFTNALLDFLIVVGTMGCFLKPFSVKANMFIVIIAVALIAIYTSFLYYNTLIKAVGYLLAFSGFIYGIVNYRFLIRGGFAYICNRLMKFLEDEFLLPIERSYDVYGYGETFSVTVCLIFIAFATMLLFNMVISESKGFVFVFLFTFPITQMAMYFDLTINVFYFTVYIVGLLGLYFLRNSKHYRMESKKKKGYRKTKKKNHVIFDYINDGRYSLSFVIILFLCIASVMLLFRVAYPQKKFSMSSRFDELKDNTRDFTEQLALVGFWGMLNPEGSAGGVGRSRLGQSKYVRLDYQTDLIVRTLIERGEGSIYLKSFNGSFYKNEYWETIREHEENEVFLEDYGLVVQDIENITKKLLDMYEAYPLASDFPDYGGEEKKIEIANVGAASNVNYIPNYVSQYMGNLYKMINDDEIAGGLGRHYKSSIWYTPVKNIRSVDNFRDDIAKINEEIYDLAEKLNILETDYSELEIERRYSGYVHDMYMEVPDENIAAIKEFCERYNLNRGSEDIVEKVAAIFEEDYEYTLMPGRTPKNKEFVNYFLSETKKGYCAYFATSATLIFRYLGIPARYTGGYVLQSADFLSGTQVDLADDKYRDLDPEENKGKELYSEWSHSQNRLEGGYPIGLCEYEIDDSAAHAWVEIYIDGFGWLPVETTPPSDDTENETEDQTNNNLMDFFANNVFNAQNINNVRRASVSVLLTIIGGAFLLMVAYVIAGIFFRFRRRNSKSVIQLYDYMVKCLEFMGLKKEMTQSYEEFGQDILDIEILDGESVNKITRIVEKEKFSLNKNEEEDIEYMSHIVLDISAKVYGELKWYKKIIYRYIKWL